MRRWIAAPLVFAVALGLAATGTRPASGQPKKDGPTAETIKTADGVELNSLFYAADATAAPNAGAAPVVVFLYPPGPDRDMTKGDWGGLAKELNKAGYHVLQFDWRGHGKSTNIKDKQKFWENVFLNTPNGGFNSYIRGRPPKMPLKNDIHFKDITNPDRFMPAYLNDLAAVRYHLDLKNDNNELNSSSIYIVGAGDATALGMAWITAEWKRQQTYPKPNQLADPTYMYIPQQLVGGITSAAGEDFGAAVWLTPSHPLSFQRRTIQSWVSNNAYAPKLRENNPMLFLYAEKDANGKTQSKFFYDEVLVAEPRGKSGLEKLDQTFIREVKGGAELKGLKLLGNDATLKTETTILQYFAAIQKVRQKIPSRKRGYADPYYLDGREFGLRP